MVPRPKTRKPCKDFQWSQFFWYSLYLKLLSSFKDYMDFSHIDNSPNRNVHGCVRTCTGWGPTCRWMGGKQYKSSDSAHLQPCHRHLERRDARPASPNQCQQEHTSSVEPETSSSWIHDWTYLGKERQWKVGNPEYNSGRKDNWPWSWTDSNNSCRGLQMPSPCLKKMAAPRKK